MTKTALITGITGQDGSYLAELLLDKGYEVHGLIRRSSSFNTGRIDHLYHDPHESGARLFLHYGDLTDSSSLIGHLHRIKPAEVYNLGAQSHVKVSFEMPEFTADTAGMGTLRMLEAVRTADWPIRFYQAGSSEMYGQVVETPQSETTPFHPRSPYAIAKVFAHWMTVQYREAYGIHASNGILFNHESPRRGGTFVTRKVTRGIAAILAGRDRAPLPRQPRRQARLGLRGRVRRGDVARCSSSPSRTTTSSRPARCTRSASCARSPSASSGSIGNATSGSTSATSDRPRWTILCGDASKAERVLDWRASTTLPRPRPPDARGGSPGSRARPRQMARLDRGRRDDVLDRPAGHGHRRRRVPRDGRSSAG